VAVSIDVTPVPLEDVLPLRELYRREMNCQIVHDSLPRRGFGDLFLLRSDGRLAGYGFVMGYQGEPKDMIREFYVLPAYRGSALPLFRRLIEVSRARRIVAQTNDALLTLMLYDCASEITSDTVVFADALTTSLAVPGAILREVADADQERIFEHKVLGNPSASGSSWSTAASSGPGGSPRTTTRRTATSSWRWTSLTVAAGTGAT
jgi:GNAT superfamily N-acetyltransferase